MRLLTLIFALMLFSLPMFGGEFYIVKNKMDADVIVYIAEHQREAHIWITTTDVSMYAQHRDYYWKFVDYKLPSVIKVYFTNDVHEADLIIWYAEYALGWKKPHRLREKLH